MWEEKASKDSGPSKNIWWDKPLGRFGRQSTLLERFMGGRRCTSQSTFWRKYIFQKIYGRKYIFWKSCGWCSRENTPFGRFVGKNKTIKRFVREIMPFGRFNGKIRLSEGLCPRKYTFGKICSLRKYSFGNICRRKYGLSKDMWEKICLSEDLQGENPQHFWYKIFFS